MNLKHTVLSMTTAIFLSSVTSAYAHVSTNPQSFWNKNEEGWFWYKQDPNKIKPKKKEEKPKAVVAESKKEPEKKEESRSKAPQVFSAEWVRKNLEVYKQLAWDEPTVENLRAYLYLQRFAIDRSEQFAHAGQLALEGDPYLDEMARHPMGGQANKDIHNQRSGENEYVLKKLFKKVGLFFVFKNDCYICDKQASLLKLAQKDFDVSIQAVSLEEPNENNKSAQLFPEYIVNPNIAKEHNIRALPSTFFFNGENGDIKPLLQGFATYSELTRRTLNAATKYHWLPTDDLNLVKPVDDITSLSSVLTTKSDLAKRIISQKEGTNPYGEDTNFIKPDLLVKEIIKEKEKNLPSDFIPRGF